MSEQQKKRRKARFAAMNAKTDKSKQKLKDNFISEQMKTPEFDESLKANDPKYVPDAFNELMILEHDLT